MKAKEWDELMKGKKFQVLQPTLLGCFWEIDSDMLHNSTMRALQQFSIHMFENQAEDEQLQGMYNGKLKEEQSKEPSISNSKCRDQSLQLKSKLCSNC